MKCALVLVVLGLISTLSGLATTALGVESADSSDRYLGIFYADDGKFSGVGEAEHILELLVNQTQLSFPDCGSASEGYLPGANGGWVHTLVVATGIGALNAAMCSRTALNFAPLTHVIYTGTSGISRFHKGGLEPTQTGGCAAPTIGEGSGGKKVHPLGSMCITSMATDLTCGVCVHSNSVDSLNECSKPDCVAHDNAALCGPCNPQAASNTFAADLYAFSRGVVFPKPTAELKTAEMQFWKASGYEFHSTVLDAPLVSDQCVEGDYRQILASGPAEYQCRDYTAKALNNNPNNNFTGLTSADVPCFGAMEGIGFLQATKNRPNLHVAILRGGSNWDHKPLYQSGGTASNPIWFQNLTYASAADQDKMTKDGYAYAILTTNTLVLAYVATLQ